MTDMIEQACSFIGRCNELGLGRRSEVAKEIGVSVESVRQWQIGKKPVPKYAWNALARLKKMRS